jgi:hypothetical protein
MPLSRFTSGPPDGIRKLNAMVDALNDLGHLRGDDKFITLRRGPSGALISLNLQEVVRLVPKRAVQIGQPVPITNNSDNDCPKGGLCFLDGSVGSDSEHYGIKQPLYPGIAQSLVIADDDIPAGGDGLGWPMDGCVHPIYDPDGICVVDKNVGAQGGSWAPLLFDLGPIAITTAAVSGLAQGLLHGKQGDEIYVIDPATGRGKAYKAILCGTEITLGSGPVSGDFPGTQE